MGIKQSTNDDRKREAIIILAAKMWGGQDSLPQYQDYLKKAKNIYVTWRENTG